MTHDPMTVLVAGGAGFIGFHLSEALLRQGHRVICLDNFQTGARRNVAALSHHAAFRVIRADVSQPIGVPERLDRIYNLACAASPPLYQADPVHTMMTNVVGTEQLIRLAEQNGARFVQASTSEVYGDPEQHPQREDYVGHVNCTGPRACYDEGKRAAEALCHDMRRLGRADVRIARIFNTYGPRMNPDDGRIVSNLVVQALTGQPMTIYGTGQQTRSFCHVSDMVAGLLALMEVPEAPEQAINLGNPAEFTIAELAAQVQALVPTAAGTLHRPLPQDDPRRRRPDISAAKALLDWEPTVPLAEGLPDTVDWFAGLLGQPDWRGSAGSLPRGAAAR